jgi:hypothetical protein
MKKTRTELIDAGKVWQVYNASDPDNILFEGVKTHCQNFIRINNLTRSYKRGEIRMGKLIYEQDK